MAVLVDTSITGSVIATGTYRSLTVPVGFIGTASKALLSDSGSYALTSSYSITSSYVNFLSASQITGQPLNVLSASYASNSYWSVLCSQSVSSSYADLAQYAGRVNWPLAGGTHLMALDETRVAVDPYRTIPTSIYGGATYVVNNKVYLAGGVTTGAQITIYTSSFGNPIVVGQSPLTLPSARFYQIVRQIGQSLYMFGGLDVNSNPTASILIADTATPDLWSQAGTMSVQLGAQQFVGLNGGNDLWMFGGGMVQSGAPFSMSMYATGSNPLSWSLQPITWTNPAGFRYLPIQGTLTVIGDKMYYYGGFMNWFSNPNVLIQTASVSNPTVWGTAVSGSPRMCHALDAGIIVGNYIYFFGQGTTSNATTNIYRAPLDNPTQLSASTVGTMSIGSNISQPFIFSGSVYIYGGYTTARVNYITKAPIADLGPTASSVVNMTTDPTPFQVDQARTVVVTNYYDNNIQAMTASVAAQISSSALSEDVTYTPVLVAGAGIQPMYSDYNLDFGYNPARSLLSVPNISASLLGTASRAITASFADVSTIALNVPLADTASYAFFAETASYAQTVITQQLDISNSYASSSTYASASLTSDYAILAGNSLTASLVVSSSNAFTASYALVANAQYFDYIGVQVFS